MAEPGTQKPAKRGFWFDTPWATEPFLNEVTEARDLCAAERNYLSMLKSSLALTLAAGSCLLRYAGSAKIDYALSYILLFLAFILPFLVLLNYAKFYNGIQRGYRLIHTKKILMISVVLTAAATIAINIREMCRY